MILRVNEYALDLRLPISKQERRLLMLFSDNQFHDMKELSEWMDYWNTGTASLFFRKCVRKFNLNMEHKKYHGFRLINNIYIE